MTDAPEPPPGPAESRAVELLRLVGSQTPEVSSGFTADVVARARAQRAMAVPLRAFGGLVAALAVALAAVVRSSGSGKRRP
jgi:hypothetical protein